MARMFLKESCPSPREGKPGPPVFQERFLCPLLCFLAVQWVHAQPQHAELRHSLACPLS